MIDYLDRPRSATVWTSSVTGWYWIALVAALVALVPAVLAVGLTPTWPEMGRRYDAPVGQAAGTAEQPERENLDLWKAMDEGRDPTV